MLETVVLAHLGRGANVRRSLARSLFPEALIFQRHEQYMRLALSLAEKSPPKPTNYRVGAVLVDQRMNKILATGYTLELAGNTHAEQCCLQTFALANSITEDAVADALPIGTVLYTTVEPCGRRLSGNLPCVERILATAKGKNGGISKVYVGVREPEKFVGQNASKAKFEEAGIEYIIISGLEEQILRVATAGHSNGH